MQSRHACSSIRGLSIGLSSSAILLMSTTSAPTCAAQDVSVSLKCNMCAGRNEPKDYQLEGGRRRRNPFKGYNAGSLDRCAKSCDPSTGCQFISYEEGGWCVRFSECTPRLQDSGHTPDDSDYRYHTPSSQYTSYKVEATGAITTDPTGTDVLVGSSVYDFCSFPSNWWTQTAPWQLAAEISGDCAWRVDSGFHGNGEVHGQFRCEDTGGTLASAESFCLNKPECIGFDWREHNPHAVCWYFGGGGKLEPRNDPNDNTDAHFLTCRLPEDNLVVEEEECFSTLKAAKEAVKETVCTEGNKDSEECTDALKDAQDALQDAQDAFREDKDAFQEAKNALQDAKKEKKDKKDAKDVKKTEQKAVCTKGNRKSGECIDAKKAFTRAQEAFEKAKKDKDVAQRDKNCAKEAFNAARLAAECPTTKKVGEGWCLNKEDNNGFAGVTTRHTLEDCIHMLENAPTAVGMNYYKPGSRCRVLYDEKSIGKIDSSSGDENWECHKRKPWAAPAGGRRLRGNVV